MIMELLLAFFLGYLIALLVGFLGLVAFDVFRAIRRRFR